MLQPADRLAGRGGLAGAVQAQGCGLEQRLDGQRGLAAPRHARHADEAAQREFGGDVFQVVAGGLDHGDLLAVALAAGLGDLDRTLAGQILSGQAVGIGGDLGRRALADHGAAMHPRPRPHVKDIVGMADRILVMLDHQDRVALVAQVHQRGQQPVVVALVQADRRLVQNVQHARQARPDLAGQANALAFATRQRARRARQGQIVQAHIDQESQPLADLLEDCGGDLGLLLGQVVRRVGDPVQRFLDRKLHDLAHVVAGDLDRQRLGLQAIAPAGAAGAVVLITLELLAHPGAVSLAQAAFHVGNHALEDAADLIDTAGVVEAELDLVLARPAQEHLLDAVGQVLPRGLLVEPVMLRQRVDGLGQVGRLGLGPRHDRALVHRQGRVGHDQAVVEEQLDSQTVTDRAGAERRVERKQPRLDLGDGEAADGACELLGEGQALGFALGPLLLRQLQMGDAVGQVQRGAQTVCQPRLQPLAHDDAVDHDVDVVAELLVQGRRVVQVVEGAVDLDPLKALAAQLGQLLLVLALAVADDGGQQIGARPFGQGHGAVDHVLHLLRLDRQAGHGGIGRPGAREQQTQIIVDLGDRAHGGTRVLGGRLLLDADRGGQAADMVDIGLAHHVQELARIGRQAFDIAALPLGIDRVEGQGRLAGPRQTGDHHQLIAGDIHVDVFQIVFARAANLDELLFHTCPSDQSHQIGTLGRKASSICERRRNIAAAP